MVNLLLLIENRAVKINPTICNEPTRVIDSFVSPYITYQK